ncbi:hypothetical protein JL720_16436 [Aureococcus anophagefferens]|nr:hypothetical protein JL720_16436 [Aureococcus anophagefferens]
MNEWRGALGAYVQKLGEYDCLSDDDEKEPALRAELLSTVLKSGTSPDDDARRRAAEKSALGRLSSPIARPEALEDIYAEASASGVGVDDLAALVHALHDARRSRRDDDSLDDRSGRRPGDDREAIFQAIAALAVEAPRLTEAERRSSPASGSSRCDADAVVGGQGAADDEDASLDKLREADLRQELPRTADVVRLEARVAARSARRLFQARARGQGRSGRGDVGGGLRRRAAAWQALADGAAPLFETTSDEAARRTARLAAPRGAALDALDDAVDRDDLDAIEACVDAMPAWTDDRDDERRHVALVAGSFDGATGAYLGPRSSARDGGGRRRPGDGGEYLLDGAALDVYARGPLLLRRARRRRAAAGARGGGAAERGSVGQAPSQRARGAPALAEYDDLDAGREARQRLLRAARCGRPGDAAAAPGFQRRGARPRGTADALSARLDVEALLGGRRGAGDLGGSVLAIDRARFGGVGLDSPAYTRAVAKASGSWPCSRRATSSALRSVRGRRLRRGRVARPRAPDELAAISAKIDALCEAQERAFRTPKSGDRAVPVRPAEVGSSEATLAAVGAVAEPGPSRSSPTRSSRPTGDAAAWPPRALVDAVSAAPPLILALAASRSTAVDRVRRNCTASRSRATRSPGPCSASAASSSRSRLPRVDEAPPAPDLRRRRPREDAAPAVRADAAGAGSAPCAARSPHVDLLAQLRAVSLKRRTVDRAEARAWPRTSSRGAGAEVRVSSG